MIKSQKKASNSYNPEIINSYIFNWPLKRIVINPKIIVGGTINRGVNRPRLPEPLAPTPYIPPRPTPIPAPRRNIRPVPKPRILSRRPIPLPRNNILKPIRPDIAKLIEKITPYYKPEFISASQRGLNKVKNQREVVQKRDIAMRGYAKSYDITIIDDKDPRGQLNVTTYTKNFR